MAVGYTKYDDRGHEVDDIQIDTTGFNVIQEAGNNRAEKNLNRKAGRNEEIIKGLNVEPVVKNEEIIKEPNSKEPATEEPAVEEQVAEEQVAENMEICAAAVIEVQGKEVMVFNKSLMIHAMNQDVKEKLHVTRTNAFVDKVDIENLHTIAQECSLNGIDPFSSPQALREMFDRAVAEGVIEIEQAPDLTKNIIIGDKVYFKNGQVADLDENAITFDVGQLERILEAENPEQMKEMVEQIKESRPMDGPVQDGPVQSGPSAEGPTAPSGGIER